MERLGNIPLRTFLRFLESQGLKRIRTAGGHLVYSRRDLRRPIVVQSHVDPGPEFIVRNNLRTLGMTVAEFKKITESM